MSYSMLQFNLSAFLADKRITRHSESPVEISAGLSSLAMGGGSLLPLVTNPGISRFDSGHRLSLNTQGGWCGEPALNKPGPREMDKKALELLLIEMLAGLPGVSC